MDIWRQQFPAIPGTAIPSGPNPYPVPGHDGGKYPIFVPSVDDDGNDIAGIRVPMVVAPLATYTGWNLRSHGNGAGAMYRLVGSTIPFASSRDERLATMDPRRSIEERYGDLEGYVTAIVTAAEALVQDGLLLEEDVARAKAAAAGWGHPLHAVRLSSAAR